MLCEKIEIFITTVEEGSFNGASKKLGCPQSAVSAKIRQLEDEFDIVLFHRNRGRRTLTLTEQGKSFLLIAEQWMDLYKKAKCICQEKPKSIRVLSGNGLVNMTVLAVLSNYDFEEFDSVKFDSVNDSEQLYEEIRHNKADIGIACDDLCAKGIRVRKILSKNMCLICGKDTIFTDLSKMDPEKEAYVPWGRNYEVWHNSRFPEKRVPKVLLDNWSFSIVWVSKKDNWMIVPYLFAVILVRVSSKLTYYELKDVPVDHVWYLVTNEEMGNKYDAFIHVIESAFEEYCR